jgi:hypothetical protein
MTTTHTPGPWAADQTGLVTAGKNRLHIAQTMTTGMGYAVGANAALIAAAPDLLAALHATMRALGDLPSTQKPGTRTRAAYDDARAAIAKATGV